MPAPTFTAIPARSNDDRHLMIVAWPEQPGVMQTAQAARARLEAIGCTVSVQANGWVDLHVTRTSGTSAEFRRDVRAAVKGGGAS